MSEIQFLVGRRPTRSYSFWGTRHHCPMEVGAYGLTYSRLTVLRYATDDKNSEQRNRPL